MGYCRVYAEIYNFTHPGLFQGNGKKPPYFEGWYYRIVSLQGRVLVFIPGISLAHEGSHSFIQFADSGSSSEPGGSFGPTEYFTYPPGNFIASTREMLFSVGESFFSKERINIEISGQRHLSGSVRLTNEVSLGRTPVNPGIMGPFSYLPLLPCRHEVIAARAGVNGSLLIGGERLCLDGGTAYIEKDWGEAFPDSYFWVQACDFNERSSSFMLSAARLRVMGKPYVGLISYLYSGSRFTRIASYTGARLDSLTRWEDGGVTLTLHDERYALQLQLNQGRSGELLAPMKGGMSRSISECLDAELHLTLRSRCGRVIFEGTAGHAGYEVCGSLHDLVE